MPEDVSLPGSGDDLGDDLLNADDPTFQLDHLIGRGELADRWAAVGSVTEDGMRMPAAWTSLNGSDWERSVGFEGETRDVLVNADSLTVVGYLLDADRGFTPAMWDVGQSWRSDHPLLPTNAVSWINGIERSIAGDVVIWENSDLGFTIWRQVGASWTSWDGADGAHLISIKAAPWGGFLAISRSSSDRMTFLRSADGSIWQMVDGGGIENTEVFGVATSDQFAVILGDDTTTTHFDFRVSHDGSNWTRFPMESHVPGKPESDYSIDIDLVAGAESVHVVTARSDGFYVATRHLDSKTTEWTFTETGGGSRSWGVFGVDGLLVMSPHPGVSPVLIAGDQTIDLGTRPTNEAAFAASSYADVRAIEAFGPAILTAGASYNTNDLTGAVSPAIWGSVDSAGIWKQREFDAPATAVISDIEHTGSTWYAVGQTFPPPANETSRGTVVPVAYRSAGGGTWEALPGAAAALEPNGPSGATWIKAIGNVLVMTGYREDSRSLRDAVLAISDDQGETWTTVADERSDGDQFANLPCVSSRGITIVVNSYLEGLPDASHIYTSPDGIRWSRDTQPSRQFDVQIFGCLQLADVTYIYGINPEGILLFDYDLSGSDPIMIPVANVLSSGIDLGLMAMDRSRSVLATSNLTGFDFLVGDSLDRWRRFSYQADPTFTDLRALDLDNDVMYLVMRSPMLNRSQVVAITLPTDRAVSAPVSTSPAIELPEGPSPTVKNVGPQTTSSGLAPNWALYERLRVIIPLLSIGLVLWARRRPQPSQILLGADPMRFTGIARNIVMGPLESERSTEILRAEASRLLAVGQDHGAANLAERVLTQSPNDLSALLTALTAYLNLQVPIDIRRTARAIRDLAGPADSQALYAAGWALLTIGESREASDIAERLRPTLSLGWLLSLKVAWSGADGRAMRVAMEHLGPGDIDALVLELAKADEALLAKDWKRAIEGYERFSAQRFAHNAGIRHAIALFKLGKRNDAVDHLTRLPRYESATRLVAGDIARQQEVRFIYGAGGASMAATIAAAILNNDLGLTLLGATVTALVIWGSVLFRTPKALRRRVRSMGATPEQRVASFKVAEELMGRTARLI